MHGHDFPYLVTMPQMEHSINKTNSDNCTKTLPRDFFHIQNPISQQLKNLKRRMNSRALAAFLSSLISELLLLLLILFPSINPLTITSNSNSTSDSDSSNFYGNIFPLIHHFLSSSEIAASLSLLRISRKRKRTHQPESDTDSTDEDQNEQLGTRLSRVKLSLSQNPDSFKLCFKMTSATFEWLSSLLEPLLECRDPAGSPLNLSPQIRLGVGLYRLATGSDYPEISRRFGVSQSIARFCVKQLCRVLCNNFRFWVGFPIPSDLESISSDFEALTGLPNCCGVLNCTRFKISREKTGREETIGVQIVSDSSSRILSIVAGFNSKKGDYRALKSSTLYKDIEGGSLLNSPPVYIKGLPVNQYLIGDGGYPLLPWLMVPFVDPKPGSFEENFNNSHHFMRRSALKTATSLRNWGVLNRPIDGEFKTVVAYVGACSILHNGLLMRDDFSALVDGLGEFSVHDDQRSHFEENPIDENASMIRSALATKARHFRSNVN